MEEKYTWAQIHGQVGAVMSNYKGMLALLDMMGQAAEVEAYLSTHEAQVAELDAALDVGRKALLEVSEAYTELQDVMAVDKEEHAEAQRKMARELQECVRQHEARITGHHEAAQQAIDQVDEVTRTHCEDMERQRDVATAALELIYEKLEEADKKLAALRESL